MRLLPYFRASARDKCAEASQQGRAAEYVKRAWGEPGQFCSRDNCRRVRQFVATLGGYFANGL